MGLSVEKITLFTKFVEQHLGIVYSPQVYFQMEQRLEKVALFLGLTGGVEALYQKALNEGIKGDFKTYFLDVATNNETSFFRDPKVFKTIENHLIPNLNSITPSLAPTSRIWCAASSFGQEPYSLAMLVSEFLSKNQKSKKIEIIGSDISEQALKRCNEARYTQLEVQRGLPALKMVQYLSNDQDGFWTLKPEIKKLVQFHKQNLLDPINTLGKFDLILCRYVLIYQDSERKAAILKKLLTALNPGGHLILGASESAFGLSIGLDQQSSDGAIYYRLKSAA